MKARIMIMELIKKQAYSNEAVMIDGNSVTQFLKELEALMKAGLPEKKKYYYPTDPRYVLEEDYEIQGRNASIAEMEGYIEDVFK